MGPITNYRSSREVLKAELADRARRNPSYSLRAFSRDLQVSPARLSEIINGGQSMSARTAMTVSERLGLSTFEVNFFQSLVDLEGAKSEELKRIAEEKLTKIREELSRKNIAEDAFSFISHWHHLAILELAQISGFECTAESAAEKLGIEVHEAELALERLERLNLVELNGQSFALLAPMTKSGDYPIFSSAVKEYHEAILDKAKSTIDSKPRNERNLVATTVAIDKSRIKEFIARMNELHQEFVGELEQGTSKSDVYCLSTQLFSLSAD